MVPAMTPQAALSPSRASHLYEAKVERSFVKTASAIMFIVLLLCVIVQINDPDPIRWMLLYGAGALLSVLAFRRIYTPAAPLLLLAYFGIAVYLMPTWNPAAVGDLLNQSKMINHDVELAREALGLLIAAVWMAVLSWKWWQGRRSPAAEAAA